MKRVLIAMVTAVALSASPLAAGTPQFRAWDLCTPGSFRVCASVSISLDYVTGPDAAGWWNNDFTRIVVTVSNLQGLAGHELDDIGGIDWVSFTNLRQRGAPFGFDYENNWSARMELQGAGTLGTPHSEHTFIPTSDGRGTLFSGPVNGIGEEVWGCSGAQEGWAEHVDNFDPQPSTCGGRFVLTVDLDHRYDLTQATMPGLGIYSLDPRVTTCGSWADEPACVPSTPVPEPATMLLMATGLAGIGGAAIRRRRKVA